MDLADIKLCQQYFRGEDREPTVTEIKMIDTYWSDHCRHTTFNTIIDSVEFADESLKKAYDRYIRAVSYTHLDVYKRQGMRREGSRR